MPFCKNKRVIGSGKNYKIINHMLSNTKTRHLTRKVLSNSKVVIQLERFYTSKKSVIIHFRKHYTQGGFKPLNFENTILTYGSGWWPGHVPTWLEGGFGSMRAIMPIWGFAAKKMSKTEDLKSWNRALLFIPTPFDSSWRADHFDVIGCQNQI